MIVVRPLQQGALAAARTLLDALLPPACAACERPSTAVLCARCGETVEEPPAGALAAAMFGGAIAEAVRKAKFRPDPVVARALGSLWVARIASGDCPPLPVVDGVTFVPAPWRRRVARGFDLPALLAQALARAQGVPVIDALACTRTDAPLSHGADKPARARLVAGRYRARGPLAEKTLLLVDDVKTTGATLSEAEGALAEAGATVHPAAFAIAP